MAEQRAAVDRLAIVRRWTELTPDGDWVSGMSDERQLARVEEALNELAVPDLEVVPMGGGMDGGGLVSPARGARGVIDFWQEWLEPWDSFTVEMGRIEEGPKAVLIEVVQRGRLRGSTGTVETPSAAVHFFRGDRMSRIEFHLDRAGARKAAGLA
jgi:ketosteroid isomerase-like protein